MERLAAELADKGFDLDLDWGSVQNQASTTAMIKSSLNTNSIIPPPLLQPPRNAKVGVVV